MSAKAQRTAPALALDATADHRLRNQLSVILGLCDVMARELGHCQTLTTDIQEVRRAADMALAIVRAGRVR